MAKKKIRNPLAVGNSVFIRGVTNYYTGKIVEIVPGPQGGVLLDDAAWIADTGRFHQALEIGVFSEVEPYPAKALPILVGGGVICDVAHWPHALPKSQK